MYNNQDGEYRYINKFPAALGKKGALFKWFILKFIPDFPDAQRPTMYIDGDESFSIGGIERTINNEVFMKRNTDYDFFAKFDAIDRFVKNNSTIVYGQAMIIREDSDGFVVWQIRQSEDDDTIMIAAKYSIISKLNDAAKHIMQKTGIDSKVLNKTIEINSEFTIASEYIFDGQDFVETDIENATNKVFIDEMLTYDFKIYKVIKN